MNSILSTIVELLGWVLLHFLWQGMAVALVLSVFLRLAKKSVPQVRYAAAGAALLLMLAAAAGTLGWQISRLPSSAVSTARRPEAGASTLADRSSPDRPRVAASAVPLTAQAAPGGSPSQETATVIVPEIKLEATADDTAASRLRPWLPWMVALWAAGVAFFSLRLLNGWRMVKRWRLSGCASIPDDWPKRFAELCQRLKLTRPVRLLSSASLAVPVVIGWLKPVVLVPAGLFAGLSVSQLEALLAHELAHVRRHDYLVNLLQNVVETLFFYHPAVWWVSTQLRKEREHCCDDVASSHSGGVLDYARALTALEELRGIGPALGMSAAGGSLLHRVRRLAGVSEERASGIAWPLGLITLGAAALTLPFTLLHAAETPFSAPQAAHTGTGKRSAYCVHDGSETHFILIAGAPFTSSTSSGANPKIRTWHDDGRLTFDGGAEVTFSRKSDNPDKLNLIAGGGKDGSLTATSFDLKKGRVFLITPDSAPRQLSRKSPPVTTLEAMETLFESIAADAQSEAAAAPVIRGINLKEYKAIPNNAGQLPDLYEPDLGNLGMWRQKFAVFEMPLYGSSPEVWLKYPAGSSSFYIESKGLVWAIPGDPVDMLKLKELLREQLAQKNPADALLRLSKMIRHGDDRLRAAAYSLMQERTTPVWRFDFNQVINAAEAALQQQPDAPSAAAGAAALAHLKSVTDAAIAAWEKNRVRLPDSEYHAGVNAGNDPNIVWSDPDPSGMSLGCTKFIQGAKWKTGDRLDLTLWLRNDSKGPVKFSYTNRQDDGLRLWAVNDKGRHQDAEFVMNTAWMVPSRVRLEPGQKLEWKKFSVYLTGTAADGSEPPRNTGGSWGPRLSLSQGAWKMQIEGHIGSWESRNAQGEINVPAAGEWTGILLTKPLNVTVEGKVALNANPSSESQGTVAGINRKDDTTAGEKVRVQLPDSEYHAGVNAGNNPGIIWSEPDKSGMSIGCTKPSEGAEWKIGDQIGMTMWIRNDSKETVKFSYLRRMDEELRMWATDGNGLRRIVEIVPFDGLPIPQGARLEPGQMLEWKRLEFVIARPNEDGSSPPRRNDDTWRARLSLPPGAYQFQIEGHIGALEAKNGKGEIVSPAAGEWTGTLTSKPMAVKVFSASALLPRRDADSSFPEIPHHPSPPVAGNPVETGVVWTDEQIAQLNFGKSTGDGLRMACVFDHPADTVALGEAVKYRLIIHNQGKEAVEFIPSQWRRNAKLVTVVNGKEHVFQEFRQYGFSPHRRYRLEPGRIAEVPQSLPAVGDFDSNGSCAIPAAAGDELTIHYELNLNTLNGPLTIPGLSTVPPLSATADLKVRVVDASTGSASVVVVTCEPGLYELAPGVKLKVSLNEVAINPGEPKRSINTVTVVRDVGSGIPPEEVTGKGGAPFGSSKPGTFANTLVWRRGTPRFWIVNGVSVLKCDVVEDGLNKSSRSIANWREADCPDKEVRDTIRQLLSVARPAEDTVPDDSSITAGRDSRRVDELVLKAGPDGAWIVNGQVCDQKTLVARLKDGARKNPKRPVTIRADAGTPYQSIVRLLGMVHEAGLTEVTLAQEKSVAAPETPRTSGAVEKPVDDRRREYTLDFIRDGQYRKTENVYEGNGLVSHSVETSNVDPGWMAELSDQVRKSFAGPDKSQKRPSDKISRITVELDGTVQLDGSIVDEAALKTKLADIAREDKNRPLIFRSNSGTDPAKVAHFLNMVRDAGMLQIGLATGPRGVKTETITIKIEADGTLQIDGEATNEKSLKERMAAVARENKFRSVVIRGDKDTDYARALQVFNLALEAGMVQISLATASPDELPPPSDKPAAGEKDASITVSGEVNRPGKYRLPGSGMTLQEAIGTAGDLNAKGKQGKIVLKRDGEVYQNPAADLPLRDGDVIFAGLEENPGGAVKPNIPAPDPFAVPTDPEKFAEALRTGIRVNVLDSSGKKGIPEFRVIAGVKSQTGSGKDEGIANWQPHTLHTGRNGGLIWPLDKAYDVMALRVEADGYEPQVFAWLEKKKGPQDLFFQLVESAGTPGRVLTPDGKPAAGANVALAMVQRDAVIDGGKLRHAGEPLPEKASDRWRWPRMVTTDADGDFRLPPEYDPTAAVLVVHESGVREMPLAEFKKTPEVKLQPWGRIEGKVLWGDKAGADQKVSLSIHRDTYGYPGVIAQYEKTTSGADGKFIFDRVLPGLTQLSCPVSAGPNGGGITEINLTGQITHVTVQPGVTPALLGGQGRTVKGKLTGRNSWEGVTFHFHPTAPHVGFPGDDAMWKAWSEFQKSPIGPVFFRSGLKVNADGTFEIPGVLPGSYQIFFAREGDKAPIASGQFSVEVEVPGRKAEALSLPEMKANPPTPPTKKEPEKGTVGRTSVEGVPILKDIPLIGRLFRLDPP